MTASVPFVDENKLFSHHSTGSLVLVLGDERFCDVSLTLPRRAEPPDRIIVISDGHGPIAGTTSKPE